MSDREQWMGAAQEPDNSPTGSAGALLRDARMAAGVHIESIAFSLKVPVSKIEALERDDFEALPDAVFARALAGSVCRALKIDPAPVLALLPHGSAQRLPAQQNAVNASFRDGSERSRSRGFFSRLSKPLVLAVIVLLVGAGVLAWFPSAFNWADGGRDTPSTPTSAAPEALPAIGISNMEGPGAETPAAVQALPAPAASPAASASLGASNVLSTGPSAESAEEAIPAAPRLVFKSRAESWIQVKDAQGAVVLERTLKSGESASTNQAGRLAIVVGRADATDVFVAGDKRDIAASARDNVARFEVKP